MNRAVPAGNLSTSTDTVNGTRLHGIDAENHRILESKRDRDRERLVGEWISRVTGKPLDHPNDIAESLRSGQQLVALINKIKPGVILRFNASRNPPFALWEMENIGLYLAACTTLGVASAELFGVSDLYFRKCLYQVFVNLNAVARLAERLSSYKGIILVTLGQGPAYITTKSKKGLRPLPTSAPKHHRIASDTTGAKVPSERPASAAASPQGHAVTIRVEDEGEVRHLKEELESTRMQNDLLQYKLKHSQKKLQLIHLTRTRPTRKKNYPAGSPRPGRSPSTSPRETTRPQTPGNLPRLGAPPSAEEVQRPEKKEEAEEEGEQEQEEEDVLLLQLEKEISAKKQLEREVRDADSYVKATKAEIENLKKELRSKKDEASAATDKGNFLQATLEEVNMKNEVLARRENQLQEEVRSLQDQIDGLQQKVLSLEKKNLLAEEEMLRWKNKVEASNPSADQKKLEKELKRLKKQLEDGKAAFELREKGEKEAFEKERAQSKSQVDKLMKELDTEKAKSRLLGSKLDGVEKRIVLAQNTIAMLEEATSSKDQELVGLRRDIAAQIDKKDALSAKMDVLIDEMADKAKDLLELEAKTTWLEEENRKLKKKLELFKQNTTENEALASKLAEVSAEKISLVADSERVNILEKKLAEETQKRRMAEMEITFWKEKAQVSGGIKESDSDQVLALKLKLKQEAKAKKKMMEEIDELKRSMYKMEKKLSSSTAKQKKASSSLSEWDLEQQELLAKKAESMKQMLSQAVYNPQDIEHADPNEYKELLATDYGRRMLAHTLTVIVSKVPNLCLDQRVFDFLVEFLRTSLKEVDESHNKDYITLREFMRSTSRLYCENTHAGKVSRLFLRDFLTEFRVWQNMDLWEEYFYDSLIKENTRKIMESSQSLQVSINLMTNEQMNMDTAAIVGLAGLVTEDMVQWGLSIELINAFIAVIAEAQQLAVKDIETLQADVVSFTEDRDRLRESKSKKSIIKRVSAQAEKRASFRKQLAPEDKDTLRSPEAESKRVGSKLSPHTEPKDSEKRGFLWFHRDNKATKHSVIIPVNKFIGAVQGLLGDDLPRWEQSIEEYISLQEVKKSAKLELLSGTRVFGVPLEVLLEREGTAIPNIVVQMVESLEDQKTTEGLFRLSGAKMDMQKLTQKADHGDHIKWHKYSPHSVATLLKRYFKELPEPLLMFEHWKEYTKIAGEPDMEKRLSDLSRVTQQLPTCNAALLRYLLIFLIKVAAKSDQNKMTIASLATVIGPNLLYPKEKSADLVEALKEVAIMNTITEMMLKHYDALFIEPSVLDHDKEEAKRQEEKETERNKEKEKEKEEPKKGEPENPKHHKHSRKASKKQGSKRTNDQAKAKENILAELKLARQNSIEEATAAELYGQLAGCGAQSVEDLIHMDEDSDDHKGSDRDKKKKKKHNKRKGDPPKKKKSSKRTEQALKKRHQDEKEEEEGKQPKATTAPHETQEGDAKKGKKDKPSKIHHAKEKLERKHREAEQKEGSQLSAEELLDGQSKVIRINKVREEWKARDQEDTRNKKRQQHTPKKGT